MSVTVRTAKPGGSGASILCVEITAFTTGNGGHANAAFRVKRIDASGTTYGDAFTAYAFSLPDDEHASFGQVDLSTAAPRYAAGDVLRIQHQRVWLNSEWVNDWFAVDTFTGTC